MTLRSYLFSVGFVAGGLKLGMDLFTALTGEPLWRFKVYWLMRLDELLRSWNYWS